MAKKSTAKKILFVCTGNTCRSPMAEAIAKKLFKEAGLSESVKVSSAGIRIEPESKTAKESIEALKFLNIKLTSKKARQITTQMLKRVDLVVTMTTAHKQYFMDTDLKNRVFSLAELTGGPDVSDPYGGDLNRYLLTANQLFGMISKLVSEIK